MRLVVDLQSVFAPRTARRGIGLYAEQLARALVSRPRDHEVHLLLSHAGGAEALAEARRRFRDVPTDRVHALPVAAGHGGRLTGAAAEAVREGLIASLRPDAVLVSSLFELDPDCPTSISRWGADAPSAVVLYDLLPLEDPDALLADPERRRTYLRTLEDLGRADVLLAISEHTTERARTLLTNCPPVVPVLGAAVPLDDRGTTASPIAGLAGRRPVLCVGGDHPRKNLAGLVRAWGLVPAAARSGRALVIACQLSARTRGELTEVARAAGLQDDDVLLPGFLPDADLARAYREAELFVLPSFSEGLGLPALEAMQHGCPVLVSDTTSLRELLPDPAARFDPEQPASIAAAVTRALTDGPHVERLRALSAERAATYTWKETARRTWDALETIAAPPAPPRKGRSLAVVSPWPPARSGVADYALRTSAALAGHYDVTLVGHAEPPPGLAGCDRETFAAQWHRFDRVLYHVGNNPLHVHDLEHLPEAPGYVLLHDTALAGTLVATGSGLGHPQGPHGLLQEASTRPPAEDRADQRGLRAALAGAIAVQVHSPHAAAEVARGAFIDAPVSVVPLPVTSPAGERVERRTPAVVGHLGFVQAFKRPEVLIEAVGRVRARGADVEVVFVGAVSSERYQADLAAAARRHGVPVSFTGFVTEEELRACTARLDCAVQLRARSHGESSASVADLLAHGVPTIVSDVGSFADLPRDVVLHLPQAGGPEELADLMLLALGPDGEGLSRRSREYAATELSLERWAARTAQALEDAYAGSAAVHCAPRVRRAMAEESNSRDDLTAAAGAVRQLDEQRPRCARVYGSDVGTLATTPFLTGIQRVTLAVHRELSALLAARGDALLATRPAPTSGPALPPHPAIRADPVLGGVEIEPEGCRWLLLLDLDFDLARAEEQLTSARAAGAKVLVNVYDMLILSNPAWFVAGAAERDFLPWLRAVSAHADVMTVNSRATAVLLEEWLSREGGRFVPVHVVPLGVDPPAAGPRPEVTALRRPRVVTLGTVEPRKGHDDLLDAADVLWRSGHDLEVVVVGRQGWLVDALVKRMRDHPEAGRRLVWHRNADDHALESLLASATAVVVPSRGEGFGLPLLEAGARGIHVVARDLPVFREVAGDAATYFDGGGDALAAALVPVLADAAAGASRPQPLDLDAWSWRRTAERLLAVCDAVDQAGASPDA